MSPTSHPHVVRRPAQPRKPTPDRGFVLLKWQPWPDRGELLDLIEEAKRQGRIGK